MPTIQLLSPSVVNKIAAGEVIERPASVVKELLENAVDAGATRIDVVLEKGGSELIGVVDNGCGIAADELPLAIASHATSKIRSADDLFTVTTLGFRGEALASIAEVSRMMIRSRPANAATGAELEVVGGSLHAVTPVGCPVGTVVEVRNLFFNTPVRQRFLRSPQTEMSHSIESLTRLALAYPHVHFTLMHNGRLMHDLSPVADLRTRIAAFFGEELAESLIEVESESGGIRLSGYVANPMHSRTTSRMQYLFLNGRAIRDRSLQHALGEAYRGLLLTGRQPICFLRLDMPAALVDVNVHPTKQEVRFQDAGQLYSQVLGTLRTKFLTTDLTARGTSCDRGVSSPNDEVGATASPVSDLVAWAKEELGRKMAEVEAPMSDQDTASMMVDLLADIPRTNIAARERFDNTAPRGSVAEEEPLRLHRFDIPAFKPFDSHPQPLRSATIAVGDHQSNVDQERTVRPPQKALQIHNRYLVVENEAGIEVIDQHALHERILYEQIREKALAGALESQRLLVPEPVDFTAIEATTLLERADLLERLGIEIQPFGGETILISSYPAMLANISPGELLHELVEKLLASDRQPEARDLLDELLRMIACKAAVKYGDRLAPEEVDALLAQRHLVQDQHHCPHGRPTALVFTREDLDRQFKRI